MDIEIDKVVNNKEDIKLNSENELNNNINLDFSFDKEVKNINNVIEKVIDKGADYVIKAMPIPDAFKDILQDVKKSIKKDGLKNILKTAVNSSIREGLELLNMPTQIIKDIVKIKDVAIKGGLKQALGNAIDIVANKYLKNNITSEFVKDFFKYLKDFVYSKNFTLRLDNEINKMVNKKEKFLGGCKSWYESYENQDVSKMNMVAEELKTNYNAVKNDIECERENNIIQNITKLYNEKKEKLSETELHVCQNM